MKLSKYQQDVLDYIKNEKGNVAVWAVAGSGKSFTLRLIANEVDQFSKAIIIAFNKHIAEEMKTKIQRENVDVRTLHALCLQNHKKQLGYGVKVDGYKSNNALRNLVDKNHDDPYEVKQIESPICRLVGLLKLTLSEPTAENCFELIKKYSIDANGDSQTIISYALQLFDIVTRDIKTIDFDDMVYNCAVGTIACEKFDFVMIDELQDLNKAQRKVVLLSIKNGGRIIGVGDPDQSIYGFAGADTRSFESFVEETNAKVMPLSITYRCPKSHVELAKTLVPQIECSDNAIDGTIEKIDMEKFTQVVECGDLIMCRVNAPLVKPAFECIRNGKKAVILGRDIGKGLVTMINKIQNRKKKKANDINELIGMLDEYCSLQMMKAKVNQQLITDQFDTIIAIAQSCESMNVSELLSKIENIFSDDQIGVTFSSVHRAKGKEADRVFIIEPQRFYPKWGDPDEEKHIVYVAYTRGKKELYFVS